MKYHFLLNHDEIRLIYFQIFLNCSANNIKQQCPSLALSRGSISLYFTKKPL